MELVDKRVLGTRDESRVGSSPTEGNLYKQIITKCKKKKTQHR